MNRTVRTIALAAACGALFLSGCESRQSPSPAERGEAKAVSWKMASVFAATLPGLGSGGVEFTEKIERVSRGRIRLKFFDPGKLVPPLEIFDSVSKGAVDAAWSVAGYWVGKIPAAAFFTSVPFGPGATELLAWVYHGGGWELWKEIYRRSNIYPIPCGMAAPDTSGWFREPIATLEQFRGMKIRYFGLGGQVLQKLGASVQLLAGGDIYPALERGVLDALEFAQPNIDRELGFYRIAKHYYFPGWHQQESVLEFLVNLDRWNELDPAGQALIEMACQSSIVSMIAAGEAAQSAALDFFREQGVTMHYWSDEILQGFKQAYAEVIRENVEANDDFRRVYESYRAFREGYAEWARLSRIPREF
ncbi:MAG: TRAP transporter substrate-binding protein [bacterium]